MAGRSSTKIEQAILGVLRANPEGVSEQELEEELPGVNVQERAEAINSLLQKRSLQLLKRGDALIYKELDQQEAAKLKGLSTEDLLVYQIIQQSGNMGIWTRDMKMRSNLQQPQITKILKVLEGRHLIKAVKSVTSKNRKVYMLAELEPSREITGGAWYTEHEFDSEFIAVLRQQCLQFIISEAPVTLEDVSEAVRKSGITREELRLEDYQQIVSTLVFDGEIEALVSTGIARDSVLPQGTEYYRPASMGAYGTSAFTSIPCGVCPVLQDCTDDGLVSPKTCVYYQEWLTF